MALIPGYSDGFRQRSPVTCCTAGTGEASLGVRLKNERRDPGLWLRLNLDARGARQAMCTL